MRVLFSIFSVFLAFHLISQSREENSAQIDEIKKQLLDEQAKHATNPGLNSAQNELYKKKTKQKVDAEIKMLTSDAVVASGDLYVKVHSIFDKIILANPEISRNSRLVLYRSNDFNAFTMGDDVIFVHIGLLNDLMSEAQIALVLCHEIAHNSLEHVEQSLIESVRLETDKALEKEINGILRTDYGKVSALNALLLPRILESKEKSRRNEFEADSLGLIFLKNAQFDVKDALSMFHIMEKRTKNITDSLDYKKCLHISEFPSIEELDNEYVREGSLGTFSKDDSKLPYLATHPYDRDRFYRLATQLKLDTVFRNYEPKEDNFKKEALKRVDIEMIYNSWMSQSLTDVIYYATLILNKNPENEEVKQHLALAFRSLAYLKKRRVAGKYLQLQNPKFPENYDRICALTYSMSPAQCVELYTHLNKGMIQYRSPLNLLNEIIQNIELADYPSVEIAWKTNKEEIYKTYLSFVLEEIELQLYNNMKLTTIKPKSKQK